MTCPPTPSNAPNIRLVSAATDAINTQVIYQGHLYEVTFTPSSGYVYSNNDAKELEKTIQSLAKTYLKTLPAEKTSSDIKMNVTFTSDGNGNLESPENLELESKGEKTPIDLAKNSDTIRKITSALNPISRKIHAIRTIIDMPNPSSNQPPLLPQENVPAPSELIPFPPAEIDPAAGTALLDNRPRSEYYTYGFIVVKENSQEFIGESTGIKKEIQPLIKKHLDRVVETVKSKIPDSVDKTRIQLDISIDPTITTSISASYKTPFESNPYAYEISNIALDGDSIAEFQTDLENLEMLYPNAKFSITTNFYSHETYPRLIEDLKKVRLAIEAANEHYQKDINGTPSQLEFEEFKIDDSIGDPKEIKTDDKEGAKNTVLQNIFNLAKTVVPHNRENELEYLRILDPHSNCTVTYKLTSGNEVNIPIGDRVYQETYPHIKALKEKMASQLLDLCRLLPPEQISFYEIKAKVKKAQ